MSDEGTSARPSIRSLCGAWKNAATREGGIALGGESEKYRLLANGVRFHDLSYNELREAAVGLYEILLLPGMNTIISADHHFFWSWCGEVLLGRGGPLDSTAEPEIHNLAVATVRASLANVARPRRTVEEAQQAYAAREALEPNAREFLERGHVALTYMAFPLLEALARRACSSYVDLTGKVLTTFPRANGENYRVGKTCSNVGDLLTLLARTAASRSLKDDLEEVRAHLEDLADASGDDSSGGGFGIIFRWRNSSLHGETALTTIGGTVLTLGMLIALDGIRHDYEGVRGEALKRAVREVQLWQRSGQWRPSPWSYYPPFP